MRRIYLAGAAVLLSLGIFSGCGVPLYSVRPTSSTSSGAGQPSESAATPTASLTQTPPSELLTRIGACRRLTSQELHEWAVVANVDGLNGDIGFSRGQIVRVGEDHWQIATVLFVKAGSQYDQSRNGEIQLFGMEWTGERFKRFPLTRATRARNCLKNA